MVNITPRPLYPTPVRMEQEAGWASDPVWAFGYRKISGFFRDSNPWLSNQDDVVALAPLLRESVPISSVEQRIYWETNAYSGIVGICCLVWNLKVHNHVHKNVPVDPTLSYMNINHILRPISLNSILILSSYLRLDIPYVLNLSRLSTNNLHVCLCHGSYIPPAWPTLFALITLRYDSWWPVWLQICGLLIIKFPPVSPHDFLPEHKLSARRVVWLWTVRYRSQFCAAVLQLLEPLPWYREAVPRYRQLTTRIRHATPKSRGDHHRPPPRLDPLHTNCF
jgi:hypothetical protein